MNSNIPHKFPHTTRVHLALLSVKLVDVILKIYKSLENIFVLSWTTLDTFFKNVNQRRL